LKGPCWKPGLGVVRLAFVCGVFGATVGTICCWRAAWNWAASSFWPHDYYEELAKTSGAVTSRDDDGNPVLIVVRPVNRDAPKGFVEAYDLYGSPTKSQWARSKPADPNQESDLVLITSDQGWGTPDFIKLRTHPPDTTVYYRRLAKGSDTEPPISSYIRYTGLIALPVFCFLIASIFIVAVAWVADGFKHSANEP
jgi:hypothetical protein